MSSFMTRFSPLMLLTFIGGCQYSVLRDNPVQLAADDFDLIWEASEQALRDHSFELDRRDRRAGVITTLPALAAHSGEFWQRNVTGAYNLTESTLHNIYKTATVTITPGSEGGYRLEVRVEARRLSVDSPQMTTAGDARSVLSRRRPMLTAEQYARGEGVEPDWVELGPDTVLEDSILERIGEAVY